MAQPKPSSIRGGPDPRDQQEEREARIAEMLERIRRHRHHVRPDVIGNDREEGVRVRLSTTRSLIGEVTC